MNWLLTTYFLLSSDNALAADGGDLKPQGYFISTTLPDLKELSEKEISKAEKKLNKKPEKYNHLRFDLGGAYYVASKDLYIDEMIRFEEEYDKCFNTPGCDVSTKEADTENSRASLNKALQMYSDFVEASSGPNVDEALMRMAQIYEDKESLKDAVNTYQKLIDGFPNSQWLSEACLKSANIAFMDLNFDQMDVHKLYQKASENSDFKYHGQALYYLAWSEYNIGNPKQAITKMTVLIDYAQSDVDKHQMLIGLALEDGFLIAKDIDMPSLMKPAFEKAGAIERYNHLIEQ